LPSSSSTPFGPKVTTAEKFLTLAQKWQWKYHGAPHFGAGMEGKTPIERLRELGLDLPDEFARFPVMLPDEVAVIRAPKGSRCVGLLHGTTGPSAALEGNPHELDKD